MGRAKSGPPLRLAVRALFSGERGRARDGGPLVSPEERLSHAAALGAYAERGGSGPAVPRHLGALRGESGGGSQSAPVERQSRPPSPSNSLVNEPTRDRGPRAVLGGRTSGHNEREHS